MDSMPERERPVSGPTQISTQVNEGEREREREGGGREGRERVREGGGERRGVWEGGGRGRLIMKSPNFVFIHLLTLHSLVVFKEWNGCSMHAAWHSLTSMKCLYEYMGI